MAVIFDGREFAKKVTEGLSGKVTELENKLGRKLKLVSVYNPDNEASRGYTNIKAKKAAELGIEFLVYQLTSLPVDQLSDLVKQLNGDKSVDGIMVQMPLGTENDKFLIDLIDLKKDVDGLRPESGVRPATIRAVIAILCESFKLPILNFQLPMNDLNVKLLKLKTIVVGNKGLVGSRLQQELKCEGTDKDDFDPEKIKQADVVIGTTGTASLIHGYMVKDGVVAIDVGYPKGDFDPSTALRASFFTPVPGGVGPVTVAMLFANLVDLVAPYLVSWSQNGVK